MLPGIIEFAEFQLPVGFTGDYCIQGQEQLAHPERKLLLT
jgi:hypothetical protein